MKYLVTGGAGFIGREVVKQLLGNDHEVYIYDDFSFGKSENINEFESHPKFTCEKGDIMDRDSLFHFFEKVKPDIVLHLAAIHFIPFCNKFPNKTLDINTNGTYNVFEASCKLNVKRVVLASSGAIYQSTELELIESEQKPSPVDVYGISKLLCENLCEFFSNSNPDIEFVSARFFNTYGPYETNEHILPVILNQLKETKNILTLGNIKPKRDFIFVEDIAKGIIKLSSCKISNKVEVTNLGTGRQYSIEELIEKIEKILKIKITINTDPKRFRKSDKMFQLASTKKLNNLVNWTPQIDIEEGLHKLLKFEGFIN